MAQSSDFWTIGLRDLDRTFRSTGARADEVLFSTCMVEAMYPSTAAEPILNHLEAQAAAVHREEQAAIEDIRARYTSKQERDELQRICDIIRTDRFVQSELCALRLSGEERYALHSNTPVAEKAAHKIESICGRVERIYARHREQVREVLLQKGTGDEARIDIENLASESHGSLADCQNDARILVKAHNKDGENKVLYVLCTCLKQVVKHHLAEDDKIRLEVLAAQKNGEDAEVREPVEDDAPSLRLSDTAYATITSASPTEEEDKAPTSSSPRASPDLDTQAAKAGPADEKRKDVGWISMRKLKESLLGFVRTRGKRACNEQSKPDDKSVLKAKEAAEAGEMDDGDEMGGEEEKPPTAAPATEEEDSDDWHSCASSVS